MPSHEPPGNSFARLPKKSRITAQTAVPVVTGIVITLFYFLPYERNFLQVLFLSFTTPECLVFPLSSPPVIEFSLVFRHSAISTHVVHYAGPNREKVEEAGGETCCSTYLCFRFQQISAVCGFPKCNITTILYRRDLTL